MPNSGGSNFIAGRLENIKANIDSVNRRLHLPLAAHRFPIQLVCFGPSLRRTWGQIDRTKTIATVSGAHDFLRDKGIVPTYHVEFDWRPHKAQHVTNPHDTLFWLASCVHPDLVNKVEATLWHAQQTQEETDYIKSREDAFFIPGGSSAGLRAIELLYALGYRRFEIFGMDSSFDNGGWAGQHFGPNTADVIELPLGGKRFQTSIAFLMYADQFRACKEAHPDCIFNLHGKGLLQTMNSMETI
jgi:Protein of unknown function DUF115